MEDTMRDLLSKLDSIVSETSLKDKADLEAKRQALQALQKDPTAANDPEIKKAIMQRKSDLEKEAAAKGFDETVDFDQIRKDAASHLKKSLDKQSDDRIAKLKSVDNDGEPFMAQVGRKIIGGVKGAVKGAVKGFSGKEDIDEDIYQVGDDFGISFSEDFEIGTEIVDIIEDGIVIELDETAIDYLSQNGFTFEEVNLDEAKKKGLDGKACWKGYRYAGTKMKGGKRVDNCVKVGEDLDEEQTDEAKYQGREVPLGKPMKGDVKKSKVYVRGPKGNVVKVNFGDKKMKIKKSNPKRRKSFRARHNCSNPGPRWKARYWSCRAW